MIRELILVSADLSAVPWFTSRVPPRPPLPAGVVLQTASLRDLGIFESGPISRDQAAQRLSQGDTCFLALTSSARLAAQMWCTEQVRFIDWIGCDIRPPEGHVHIYNSWVEPEFRGLGLHWNLAAAACGDVVARGRSSLCAGVERKEYAPFARKYAAMGLAVLVPYKSVWSWRVHGVTLAAIPCPPTRSLEKARETASKLLPRGVEQHR